MGNNEYQYFYSSSFDNSILVLHSSRDGCGLVFSIFSRFIITTASTTVISLTCMFDVSIYVSVAALEMFMPVTLCLTF